jgi:predicted secreted hydrolase
MNARALVVLALLWAAAALAQGFGGLGGDAQGFETPKPGGALTFPADHSAHKNFRTEWWYVTANLKGADGASYGAQWTLFRHALEPGAEKKGWDDRTIWMGHAAITSATTHLFAQTMARGGVGQAGVEAAPFRAFIDDWRFEATDDTLTKARLSARSADFSYVLDLSSDRPPVLEGDKGYSRKSQQGQASYYYSQPFFTVEGRLTIHGRETRVTGQAWMDREWSSQSLAPDQTGWDWFAMHLSSGEKLMLYRIRGGAPYLFGNWISPDGASQPLAGNDISLEPLTQTTVGARKIPTRWRVRVKSRGFDVETTPLNVQSWMGTTIPYWEGPISFAGSQNGDGYLEMTGY